MAELLNTLIANLELLITGLDWVRAVDLLLVTVIFYLILSLLRGTQAMVLLRGVLLLIALIGLITSLEVLPAFTWLV